MYTGTASLKACFSWKQLVLGFTLFPSRLFLQLGFKSICIAFRYTVLQSHRQVWNLLSSSAHSYSRL